MATVNTLNFENEFKIATLALHFNRAHPRIRRDKAWIKQFLAINAIGVTCLVFLINSIIFHDVRTEKYDEALKNGSMAIVFLTITFKYFVLLGHQNSIENLINQMNEDYESEDFSIEEKQIILKYAKDGIKVCKFWLVSAISTGIMFPLKALFLMALAQWRGEFKLVPIFDFTYPKHIELYKEVPLVYLLLFILVLTFDIYCMSMYIGFDPLVSIFLLHVCGQIEILCTRIRNLLSEETDEMQIKQNFKQINIKLQALYNFVHDVQSNFMALFEFNMKTTTFLLPFAAFQIVQSLQILEFNVEFMCFFAASILHFFMPCYSSNLLMEKGKELREAIYSCGWENKPDIPMRKTVLIMLVRADIPLGVRTIFYPVNLETFAEMCRQAYTIFSLMNAAWL